MIIFNFQESNHLINRKRWFCGYTDNLILEDLMSGSREKNWELFRYLVVLPYYPIRIWYEYQSIVSLLFALILTEKHIPCNRCISDLNDSAYRFIVCYQSDTSPALYTVYITENAINLSWRYLAAQTTSRWRIAVNNHLVVTNWGVKFLIKELSDSSKCIWYSRFINLWTCAL